MLTRLVGFSLQQRLLVLAATLLLVLFGLQALTTLPIDAGPFVNEQAIRGCYFGSSDIQQDIPRLVSLYLSGELILDELISERLALGDIDKAVSRLRAGEGARSVIVFD